MGASRITTFAHGAALTGLSETLLASLRNASHTRRARGVDADAVTTYGGRVATSENDYGGLHRLACVVNADTPGSGSTSVRLDGTLDWRDRLLFIESTIFAPLLADDGSFPGAANDYTWVTGGSPGFGYTREGGTIGAGTFDPAQHVQLYFGASTRWLTVSDDDHSLHFEIATGDTSARISALIRIWATEQLGLFVSPPQQRAIEFAAVDGDLVEPCSLNVLQEGGQVSQVRGNGEAGSTRLDSEALALGLIVRGQPRLADFGSVAGREWRQRLGQTHRKWFAVSCPTGTTTTVDNQVDWRDRMLMGRGRLDALDIRPGQAAEASHNVGTDWRGASQSGLGYIVGTGGFSILLASNLRLFAEYGTGELRIRNDTGATRRVTGLVEASGPLGPRSHPTPTVP